MKRKFAFLLAGCLILSPISAGMISDPALAAETESSADKVPSEFSVTAVIRDGSDTVLDTEQEYNMNLDETFQIIAQFDQDSASSIPSPVFSSDAPDIVSISGDGEVNALSPGTAHIMIEFPDIPAQDSLRYTICVSEPEEEEAAEAFEEEMEVSDEAAAAEGPADASTEESAAAEEPTDASTEEAAAADTSQETAAAEEPTDASTGEAASADTSQETAAAEEPADASTEESAAAADTSQEAAAVEAPADAPTEEAAAPETAKVGTAAVKKAPAAKKASPSVSGWVRSGSSWTYILKNGTKATGRLKLGKSAFYLDSSGIMKTGWIRNGSNYYYADPQNEGRLQTGWAKIGSFTYYFDPGTYARKTGVQKINGKLYVFSSLGRRRTGPKWVTTDKGRCYVKSDNTLKKGWFKYKGKRYNFNRSGIMRTGWYKTGGKIFYFNRFGSQVTGFKKILGKKYYLKTNGSITKGWKKIKGKWYYFDRSCRMKTGWLKLGRKMFYLVSKGVMVTGTRKIGGVTYRFNSDGVLIGKVNSYKYSNTQEFINCIAPLIKHYAPQYNVKVISPIIAQAILESASGESSLGKKYNNYFGLKCGTLWKGKSVNLLTGEEYTPGTYTTIAADFRVFDNMDEGVKGYFEFLFRNRTRYNNLIGETDPYRYLEKIKDDGYATSSKYVQNVYAVIKSYNLTRFDD